MTLIFALLALILWWRGDHLPAGACAFAAISLIWPQFPGLCGQAFTAVAGTEAGSTVVLYALTFAVPVIGVAALLGWRPSYRSFSQPKAAARMRGRMSSWVIRDEPQPSGDTQQN